MSSDVFPPPSIGSPRLAWGNVRTVEFSTLLETSESGLEVSASRWVFPRYHWICSYNSLGQAGHQFGDQLRPVEGHYSKHKGSGESFLFLDDEDHTIVNQFIGPTNGATKNFQIARNYGGFVEPIYEIKASPAPVLKRANNGATISASDYTISNGLVQFTVAPPSNYTGIIVASAEFYFRVRFDDDSQDFENFTYLLHAMREVHLVSVKR